jgi:uncharacterized protein YdaU (DUF1376 family)
MNYYTYHIGDYRTATAHLTLEEDATYKRLLDYHYDKECPIPDDPAVMARRLRSTEKLVKTILSEFFTLTEQGWTNKRVMEEITGHQEFIQKQIFNGRKGGRTKAHRQPSDSPSLSLPIPISQSPFTNNIDWQNLPSELNTEQFKEAWTKYVSYRKERKKPLYQSSMEAKWKQIAAWGEQQAIASINNTIANGWQGIFPPQNTEKKQENNKFREAF